MVVSVHNRELLSACLLAVAATFASSPAAAGDLDDVRDEVRHGEDDGRDWPVSDCDDEDDEQGLVAHLFGEMFGDFIKLVIVTPWAAPHFALGDDFSHIAEFPPAPYTNAVPGHLVIDAPPSEDARPWSGRLALLYGDDFDDLRRAGARLRLDTSARFGFDADWQQWIEQVGGGHDTLAVGDFNVVYRFAQHEHVEFYSGLGFNWLADSRRADFGPNFTYGFDIFPRRPWVLSAVFDAGILGDAGYFHARTTVGMVWEQIELFVGYDAQRFGGITLDGPVAGIQFWF